MESKAYVLIAICLGIIALGFSIMTYNREPINIPILAPQGEQGPKGDKGDPGQDPIVQIVIKEVYGYSTLKDTFESIANSTVHTLNITVQEGADVRLEFFSKGHESEWNTDDNFNISLVIENNTWELDIANFTYTPFQNWEIFDVILVGHCLNLSAGEYRVFLRIQAITGDIRVEVGSTKIGEYCSATLIATEYQAGKITF